MIVTKEDVINGTVDFVQSEVVKNIPDITLKIVLGTVTKMAKNNQISIDKFLDDHEIIKTLILCDDGNVDLDNLIGSLCESIDNYGKLSITIPQIPVLLKDEITLSFTSSDVGILKSYIERKARI